MYSGVEKRGCRRFVIPGAEVRYRKTGLLALGRGLSAPTPLIDISKGGLSFYCTEKLFGKKLMVQILLSNEAPLTLKAIVRWQQTIWGVDDILTGIQFMPFTDRMGWNTSESLDILRAFDEIFGDG